MHPEQAPLFLLDENLPPAFAPVFSTIGFNTTTVAEAFAHRRSVSDEEIIAWLSANVENPRRSVWVSTDLRARIVHGARIVQAGISVLWIQHPSRKGLTSLQELQLLSLILEDVQTTVASSARPMYLIASLNGKRPKLEEVVGTLTDRKLQSRRLQLS